MVSGYYAELVDPGDQTEKLWGDLVCAGWRLQPIDQAVRKIDGTKTPCLMLCLVFKTGGLVNTYRALNTQAVPGGQCRDRVIIWRTQARMG